MAERDLRKLADDILASIEGSIEVKARELALRLAKAELGFRKFQAKSDRRYEQGRKSAYKQGYAEGFAECVDDLLTILSHGHTAQFAAIQLQRRLDQLQIWAGGEDGQLETTTTTIAA